MEQEKPEGRRPFLSALSSLWTSHNNDKDLAPLSRQSSVRSNGAPNKAVHTIGEGSFSLDDLDESFNSGKEATVGSGSQTSERGQNDVSMRKASEKKNADFHKIFKNQVDGAEPLMEDFSCAHTREILVQGRLYVTPKHVCFHSNLLGRSTNLVISYQEIIEVAPKNTVGLFPNGIVIRTLHAQHTFASFVNRTHVLKLLRSLKDNESRHLTDNASETDEEDEESDSEGENQSYDDSYNEVSSFKRRKSSTSEFSFESSRLGHSEDDYASSLEQDVKKRSRSSTKTKDKKKDDTPPSGPSAPSGSGNGPASSGDNGGDGKWPVANLGPDTHGPTSLPEMDSKEKLVDTMTIDAPLGVVANLLYGSDTSWYHSFQTNDLKNRELPSVPSFADKDSKKQRYFEYIKPLSGPIGPKQTKCKETETIEQWDMEKGVEVLMMVKTPDVPSGDAFTSFTKCNMAWAEGNKTVIRHTTWLEWTGKSWLKKPIETGALDGQVQYCKILNTALNSKLRSKGSSKGKKTKKRTSTKRPPEREKPSTTSTWTQYLPIVGYVLLGLVVVYAIYITVREVFGRSRGGSRQDALREQLELWQWLNSRLDNQNSFEKMSDPLTSQEIAEIISFTEKRLQRLRLLQEERSV